MARRKKLVTKKVKKAQRDSNITRDFFNQGEPSTSSAEQSHSQATTLTTSTELDASVYSLKKSLIDTDHRTGVEKLRTKMSALWKEKYNMFTAEEREKADKAIKGFSKIPDPHSVVQELNLTTKRMKDVLATMDEVILNETFDLADLDQVAKQYDEQCRMYEVKEEGQMATLAETISKFASMASDTTCSNKNRLVAELDVQNLNIHINITVPLVSCLRQVQLFNMEKKFGFLNEGYQALKYRDEGKLGEGVPAYMQLSFRQRLNDPFMPTEPAPEPRQNKGEGKLSGLEALAQLQRNLKLVSEEIQELKATNDTQDFEELSCVTPALTYADVPIPEGIPDHVRQRFSDADFALEQMAIHMEEVHVLELKVRSALLAWNSAGQEVWYVHSETITPIERVDRMPTHFLSRKTPFRF